MLTHRPASHRPDIHNRMRRINCVHFVGIGGSGMSGIAEVMLSLGYRVQGSDLRASRQTRRLQSQGATIFIGHAAEHIANADAVVVSSAVDEANAEVMAARRHLMPVVQRAEMLAELMRFRYSIAVAGTHGKTTTTSLVASILATAGLDPTFVIGGRLKSVDGNARLGQGDYLVAEADESDASFVHLQPMLAIVTNIDSDHIATYAGDINKLRGGFVDFLHNLPFYGLAIVCADDPGVRAVMGSIGRAVMTYGLQRDCDIRAENIIFDAGVTRFDVIRRTPHGNAPGHVPGHEKPAMQVALCLPGVHNVRNALAAIAVAGELQVADAAVITALENFAGIDRRFQHVGELASRSGKILFVDDYGHHPTEIAATLAAAKSGWPERRIVLVFQPHRYTRTRDLLDNFAQALSAADVLVLLEVYAAGEAPIAGADGRAIARAVRSRGAVEPVFVQSPQELAPVLKDIVQGGDLVLTMGAGDIGSVAAELPDRLCGGAMLQVQA